MDTIKTNAVRGPKTAASTDEELLLIAIALVKAAEEDSPDFVSHVAVVFFEALKHARGSRKRHSAA